MIFPNSGRCFDRCCGLIALLLLMLPLTVSAQAVVGTVQFVHGEAMALSAEGEDRILTRGDEIREGEVLVTGPDGAMQLQLNDGGLLALRANTEMSIDEYQYEQAEDDRSLFSVARGVFRKISGAIGQNEPASVRMQTPVATIGIRGTDFEGGFLPEDNDDPAGAYLRVNSGRAWLGNEAGELDLRPGQAGFVASSYDMPQLLEQAPGLFRVAMPTGPAEGDTGEDEGPLSDSETLREYTRGETEEDLARLNRSDDELPLLFDDPDQGLAIAERIGEQEAMFDQQGFFRLEDTGGAVAVNTARAWNIVDGGIGSQVWIVPEVEGPESLGGLIHINANGELRIIHLPEGEEPLDTAGNQFDAFSVSWGRWGEGSYIVENESDRLFDEGVGELHYMMTDVVTPLDIVIARTGEAQFDLVGGTSAISENGEVLESGQLTGAGGVLVDFDTGAMAYDLTVFVNVIESAFELSSVDASVGDFLTGGIALSGGCFEEGGPCGGDGIEMTGVAGGHFAGPEAEALISFFNAAGLDADDVPWELLGTALFAEDFAVP